MAEAENDLKRMTLLGCHLRCPFALLRAEEEINARRD